MKKIHLPTILVTLGLVGLVAILSGQNIVGSPRVTVNNPLGVPGWVPTDVWMARKWVDPATGSWTNQDYTVPTGHFALITSFTSRSYSGDNLSGIALDEGAGFVTLVNTRAAGGDLTPGVVVDEGTVIRAMSGLFNYENVVVGYLIPK